MGPSVLRLRRAADHSLQQRIRRSGFDANRRSAGRRGVDRKCRRAIPISVNGMVRPCSCPTSKRACKGHRTDRCTDHQEAWPRARLTASRNFDAMSLKGSIATEMGCRRYVRFTPNSGQTTDIAGCLKRATSGLMHCSKQPPYSIICRFGTRNAECATSHQDLIANVLRLLAFGFGSLAARN